MKDTEWKDLQWSKIETTVFQIQKQIYNARKQHNIAMVRNLQGILINMHESKLLAVHTITDINKGKDTLGVDLWNALDDNDRLSIVNQLIIDGTAMPIRRVYITKSGKSELRPFGIPTIFDRCKQCLVKLALEPEWEAVFDMYDYNSFGFRLCRSSIDAICKIRNFMIFRGASLWVFDADISKCFDKIGHNELLRNLNINEPIYSQINSWLKSGIFENNIIYPSKEGTPQGGVISPLLANIALGSLHSELLRALENQFGPMDETRDILYVRYADDFVILSPHKDVIEFSQNFCTFYLKLRYNLDINQTKSRIIQTVETLPDGKLRSNSFDFLGFRFIQRYVSRHKELKFDSGFKTRYITSVIPAPSRIQRHKASITRLLKNLGSVDSLITTLNPRIEGWCNYFKHSDVNFNRDIPRKMDLWLNAKVRKFIRRTTKKRGKCPEFWKQNTKDWILYGKTVTRDGNVIETTLNKYTSYDWNISKYKSLPKSFSPYKLPNLHGFKRDKIIPQY